MLSEPRANPVQRKDTGETHGLFPLLVDILALSHIYNALSSGCAVVIGYWITAWYHQTRIDSARMLFAAFATVLISSAGFIINDILDLEIDRINRPDRSLAAGRISVPLAWGLYIFYNLLGVVCAMATQVIVGGVGMGIVLALFLYSYNLKRRFLVGHAVIAILGAILLPFGGLAAGNLIPTLYTVPVVLLSFFGREVLKTIPDLEGDRLNHIVNFATRFGPRRAVQLSSLALMVAVIFLPAIRTVWSLNLWYMALVVFVIWPLTFLSIYGGLKHPTDLIRIKTLLRVSKLLFLFTAVAFLIGSVP